MAFHESIHCMLVGLIGFNFLQDSQTIDRKDKMNEGNYEQTESSRSELPMDCRNELPWTAELSTNSPEGFH